MQFYSDNSFYDKGFNISYTQFKGMFLVTLQIHRRRKRGGGGGGAGRARPPNNFGGGT